MSGASSEKKTPALSLRKIFIPLLSDRQARKNRFSYFLPARRFSRHSKKYVVHAALCDLEILCQFVKFVEKSLCLRAVRNRYMIAIVCVKNLVIFEQSVRFVGALRIQLDAVPRIAVFKATGEPCAAILPLSIIIISSARSASSM